MRKLLFTLLFFCLASLQAQKTIFNIKGKVVAMKQALESATVHLESVKDNTIVSYTITDVKGEFILKGNSFYRKLRLVISYVGMSPYQQVIPLNKLKCYDIGLINLESQTTLKSVVVRSRSPIVIKKDTIEFNAQSFKTKRNATVEDLLKKLPGVVVKDDGSISVNGKTVNNILVNGKPFFGDIKIATKNITKDIIEKVQVVDSKTKSQAFLGEKGSQKNKTINLTIKKNKNKGWFGRLAASKGTNTRYEAAGFLNRFNDKTRVSVLASTNNINSLGFSFGELYKSFGSFTTTSSDGDLSINSIRIAPNKGVILSKTSGLTFADELSKGMDINGNYLFTGSNAFDKEVSNREYILPNRKYFTSSTSESTMENNNNCTAVDFDFELAPTILINLNPRFNFSTGNSYFKRTEKTFDANKLETNKFWSKGLVETESKKFSNVFHLTKRIGTDGSFIKMNFANSFDSNDSETLNSSELEVYSNAGQNTIRNLLTVSNVKNSALSSSVRYRYPIIANRLFVNASYKYDTNHQKNISNTNDYENSTKKHSKFNTILSSNFEYKDITKKPNLGFTYSDGVIGFGFDIGSSNIELCSTDVLRPKYNLNRYFKVISVKSSFGYNFSRTNSFFCVYKLKNNIPSIRQMQAFKDVTNPSSIIVGNPNLKPSQEHIILGNFGQFNARSTINIEFKGSYQMSGIGIKTILNNRFLRETTYTNIDGIYSVTALATYGKDIKFSKDEDIQVSIGTSFSLGNSKSYFNGILNENINWRIKPRLKINYGFNTNHSFTSSYRIGLTSSSNKLNAKQNRTFTTHEIRFKTRNDFFNRLELLNELRYNYNPNLIGFSKSSMFWNTGISYFVVKDKVAITLKGYDILNQNLNASRQVNDNFIEDRQSTVLQQYFMLGFSWKFNTMVTKEKKK